MEKINALLFTHLLDLIVKGRNTDLFPPNLRTGAANWGNQSK